MPDLFQPPKGNLLKQLVFSKFTLFVVILLIMGFIYAFLDDSLTGFTLGQLEDQINEKEVLLSAALANNSACTSLNEKLSMRLTQAEGTNEYYKAKADLISKEKEDLQKAFTLEKDELQKSTEIQVLILKEDYEEQLTDLQNNSDTKAATLQENLAKKVQEYELFAANVGKNLCCKARVDNPSISAYDIVNSKIVCLESGGKPISC